MALGEELLQDENLSALRRFYVRIFGVPISGLRIRARRILPEITEKYTRVLDAGCGRGFFTFEIARRLPKASVVGIDVDESLVKRNLILAQKCRITNCCFETQDAGHIPWESRFDLVLSVDNLEHIENDLAALKSMRSALKENGEILLHVPAAQRRWPFFRWQKNFAVEGHVRPGYAMEEIIRKMNEAGFEILWSRYTYGWLENMTNNISYMITRAQMKRPLLYAMVFPFLNAAAALGQNARPKKGAGILIHARKKRTLIEKR